MKYQPSLRKRIYIAIGAVVVLSFIAIGTVTLIFFKNQNEQYHLDRLERKQAAVVLAIDYFLSSVNHQNKPDSLVKVFDNKICELADINNLDINIYSLLGDILINSNPDLFETDFVNEQLDSNILAQLLAKGAVTTDIVKEGVDFLNTFEFIRNEKGESIAILNLPYFATRDKQRIEVFDFLEALAEIYLILFVLAIGVGWLLSRYITKSLKEIGSKISRIQINQKNQALVWNTGDEIGQLVQEYNKKLVELEDSAEKLAMSERQSAWKEMAKQVAHEIKNPLTPLKLNVQMLERSLDPNDPNFKQKLKEFCSGTVQQIDTLTNIASAFSSFANFPTVKLKKIDLERLIPAVLQLFSDKDLTYISSGENCFGMIDPDQFTRLINNLIHNAIQSIKEDTNPLIEVKLNQHKDQIILSIDDNGSGINIEDKSRVFEPSFTTKTSGMGLGLAMVKKIVEGHKGTIWFETNNRMGTTFFVSLPLADD
ncbi:MAG: two-component system nitrogen regulation sensor histidine kinase NtrY [Flavobacteriales bacterium]|jgi:two-component system nitrogen regulation sensor histidine kinase NtrY